MVVVLELILSTIYIYSNPVLGEETKYATKATVFQMALICYKINCMYVCMYGRLLLFFLSCFVVARAMNIMLSVRVEFSIV